jgi:hypothetical protein
MQQARDTCEEKAVKAVRNREGGTGPVAWQRSAEGSSDPGVDSRVHVGREGEGGRTPGEEGRNPERGERALKESQAGRHVHDQHANHALATG